MEPSGQGQYREVAVWLMSWRSLPGELDMDREQQGGTMEMQAYSLSAAGLEILIDLAARNCLPPCKGRRRQRRGWSPSHACDLRLSIHVETPGSQRQLEHTLRARGLASGFKRTRARAAGGAPEA